MGPVKSLWASVQGDPVFMRRVNGWLALFWLLMIPISLYFGWVKSVVYVSALSLWALVSGHWSAWQAARVEVNQQSEMDARADEDIAADVVERVIARTDVNPA
jgi:capsule polysaccharide export protein KpsE/RkpR